MSDENVAADPSPAEASPERTSNRPPWRKRVLRILMLLLFFAVFIGGSAILFPVQDKVEKESSFELDIPYLALAKLLENASLGAAISRNTDSEIVTEETTKDEDNARGRLFPKILSGKRDVLRETTIRV